MALANPSNVIHFLRDIITICRQCERKVPMNNRVETVLGKKKQSPLSFFLSNLCKPAETSDGSNFVADSLIT